MHNYSSSKSDKLLPLSILWIFLFGVCSTLTQAKNNIHHTTKGFHILSAETKIINGVFRLKAKMALNFSADALEALRSGVPLIVLVNIEVHHDRNWWWDKTIAKLEQGYLLLYHALSEKYIIHNLNSGAQQNYSNLNTALSALGIIQALPILDKKLLVDGNNYYIRLRTYLDIESLPAPMRPIAYISSQWQLESDWFTWPLKP